MLLLLSFLILGADLLCYGQLPRLSNNFGTNYHK